MSTKVSLREQTALAISVLRFGEEHGPTFKPVPYRGMLAQPFTDEEFLYRDARDMPNDFTMPLEAWRRFFMVYENFDVVQVVIAEEVEPYKEWQRAVEVGKKTVIASAGITAAVAGGLLTLLAAAPMVLLADPKLIVVLDDGSWISVCEWL